MISPSSARTGSKCSAKQVHATEKRWRVTESDSVIPRLSRSSAIAAAVRCVVPRSMTRDKSHVVPSRPGGSQIDPARTARLIATAGVVRVSLAMTTTPLLSAIRRGDSPARLGLWLELRMSNSDGCTLLCEDTDRLSAECWCNRLEPANRTIRLAEHAPCRGGYIRRADRINRRCGRCEHRKAADGLEISELVGDVRDAVAVEHQPRMQLRLRFVQFGL